MAKNKGIEAMCECTNCGNKFPEKEAVWDSEEKVDFCPYCGEGGCLEAIKPDVANQEKYNVQKRYCDCIIHDANELRALFSHKNDGMMEFNFPRALADVEAIKSALAEVEAFVKSFAREGTK